LRKIPKAAIYLIFEKTDICFAHVGISRRRKYQNQKILSLTTDPPQKLFIIFIN